jgi:hypothetical protein
LLGSATEDYAGYPRSIAGAFSVARDGLLDLGRFLPAPLWALGAWGLVIALRSLEAHPAKRAAAIAPLAWSLSFFVLFNCLARRVDERFLLPQSLLCAIYVGLGVEGLFARARGPLKWPLRLACGGVLGWALLRCAAVDVALLWDTRYDAEAWLAAHVRPGDSLEVYGNPVYLPRLPPQARVSRVEGKPIAKRSPVLGAEEVVGRPVDVEQRRPTWIVVTDKQMWLEDPQALENSGRTLTPEQRRLLLPGSDRRYFEDLLAGRLAYATAHVSDWSSKLWPRVDLHASTAPRVYVFERTASR